jgi:hypothetical protein
MYEYKIFMFKIYKCSVLFYESLSFCIPGTHPTEIRYNSSFSYAESIYAGISRNLTPAQNKGLLLTTEQRREKHSYK